MQETSDEEVEWRLVADAAMAGERLDGALARGLDAFSRARVKDLIEKGAVSINGEPVSEPKRRLKLGDEIVLVAPAPEEAEPTPQDIPLDILYEDEALIVINKPVGLVVHPAPGNPDGTLVNALLFHCGASLKGIGGVKRPGIVHRLDKDTSGVMVAAKTDAAHQHLAAQFADHGRTGPLHRAYTAFVALYNNQAYTVSYLALDKGQVPAVPKPTDDQLNAIIKENASHFQLPETRVLSIVRFSAKAIAPTMPIDEAAIQKQFDFDCQKQLRRRHYLICLKLRSPPI